MRLVANDTTVLVPVGNVEGVGLRPAVEDTEVCNLFSLLGDGRIDSHQNWKGRFKDNSDRMRSGNIHDVVEVLKSLTHLSKSKSLSFREKRMLDRARFLVISELAEVTHEPMPLVEAKVDEALHKCLLQPIHTKVVAKTAVMPPMPPPPVVVAKAVKAVAATRRAVRAS